MIVTLGIGADEKSVRQALAGLGLWVESVERAASGGVHFVIAKSSSAVEAERIERVPGVVCVSLPQSARPRVDAQGPALDVGGVELRRESPVLISGPCAVESEAQIERIAEKLARLGVVMLRGGAFKPRTSPYDFQGHGERALGWLSRAARARRMKVVTEVMSERDVDVVAEHADLLQIGSRSMQSFALLKAVGAARMPVLLKRSMSASVEEWLLAGEYLLEHGARGVAFCERGVRGFDPSTRNLLDLGAVALLTEVHRLPVVVDPSHALGRRELVLPLARAALAAGAAGLMIEVHDEPSLALSDGAQALAPEALTELARAMSQKRTANPKIEELRA